MDNWLERTELLLGEEKLGRLRRAHVLVVGLGGVGAYAAEMIARAGVGRMTVADADTVNGTNINRQLVALHSTVGRPKAEVLAERLRDINPEIDLSVVNRYIRDEETYALLDAARYDYVVDAIDTLSPKLALIAAALERRLPLVSSMGAGAKTDPTRMEIADIAKTHHCPLAHMLRKRLHKIGIRSGFRAVFSPEPMREGAMILCEERNKKSNVGTISYIPPLFGIGCASVVIRGLIGEVDCGAFRPAAGGGRGGIASGPRRDMRQEGWRESSGRRQSRSFSPARMVSGRKLNTAFISPAMQSPQSSQMPSRSPEQLARVWSA